MLQRHFPTFGLERGTFHFNVSRLLSLRDAWVLLRRPGTYVFSVLVFLIWGYMPEPPRGNLKNVQFACRLGLALFDLPSGRRKARLV